MFDAVGFWLAETSKAEKQSGGGQVVTRGGGRKGGWWWRAKRRGWISGASWFGANKAPQQCRSTAFGTRPADWTREWANLSQKGHAFARHPY